MSTLYLLFEVILATLLARGFYLRYLHPLARYPGPALAAVTNLWKFFTFFGGQHHIVEQKLHDRLGPVVRVGPNSLSFSSLAGFEAIYGYNKSLEKGDFYDFARDAKTGAVSIFSARTDVIHRERRKKVVGPALSTTKVASFRPLVEKHVAVLQSRLAEALSLKKESSAVNIAPLIHRFTFDTLHEIIYGEAIAPQPYTNLKASSGILETMKMISKASWGCSLLPWLGWLMSTRPMIALTQKPTYDEDGNLRGMAALTTQTQDLVFKHPEKFLESSAPSIVKSWLQVPDTSSTRMNPIDMWFESYDLTFAGPGSTCAGLTSTLMELGTREGPDWQERIRNELKGGMVPGSSPALTAIIKESLRLHAPFPTAFPRTIAPGAENALADFVGPLPVGTTVSSNTFVIGQSKEVWGEDAQVWKPQRWLESQAEAKKMEDRFVVFSNGPRVCIGKDIVFMMITAAVSSLLQKWEIKFNGKLQAQNFFEMQYTTCEIEFSSVKA